MIMHKLILVLCVGVVSSARIYDYEGRLVQRSRNYDGADRGEGQHFNPRHGPRDGAADLRLDGINHGEADRLLPGGSQAPPQPAVFGDRANEILDENIERIRAYDESEYRGGERKGATDADPHSVVNVAQARGDDARTADDKNTQGETDASIQRSHNEAAVENARPETLVASRSMGEGQRDMGRVDMSARAAYTVPYLENRDVIRAGDCPTGYVKVIPEGAPPKCVTDHGDKTVKNKQ